MSVSQDIFTTYKNRSETWIAKNFPEFHSFIFSSSIEKVSWREKLYLYSKNLSSAPICKCGKKVKFIDIIKGYRKYCSNKCKSNDTEFKRSVEQTNIRKLGVSNPMKSKAIKEKHKEKVIQKWGVEKDYIKEKTRHTNQTKFGVDYKSQTNEARQTLSRNMSAVSQTLNASKNELLKKRLECKFSNVGIEFIQIVATSKYEARCPQGHHFEITKTTLNDRIRNKNRICTICNPVESGSDAQFELFQFISSLYDGVKLQNFRGFKKYELDIYLPQINLAFEYNGLYWHSSKLKLKFYHSDKIAFFFSRNIDIINICEDDWLYDKEETKNKIINIFSL